MNSQNRLITECAISVTLSSILSSIPVFKLINGGSVTFASSSPIIIFSFKNKFYFGLLAGLIYAIFQLLSSFHFPPSKTIFTFIAVIFLDYLIPYTSLGISSIFRFKSRYLSVILGVTFSFLIRLICSIISGILVWKEYFPTDVPIWTYSIIYNASYLIPEYIITAVICTLIISRLSNKN